MPRLGRSLQRLVIVLFLGAFHAATAAAHNWIPLFDGTSFHGWTQQDGQPVADGAWRIDGGTVQLDVSRGRGGNIITVREYGDFELVFEWKIAHRANGGIKYRVKDFDGRILGCEYQMIDDLDYGNLRPAQRSAALYDLYPPRPHEVLKPTGEFNRGAIIVCGNRIEHWLNGHQLVCATVGSADWRQRVAASKFADAEGFGENACGRIMLTDHGDEIWYRHVFLRPLSTRPCAAVSLVSLRAEPTLAGRRPSCSCRAQRFCAPR
jgi:hypothetical protein